MIDIRNYGLVGAVELAPREGAPGARGFATFLKCWEKGVMIRTTGDIIALSPALIVEESQIAQIVATLREVLTTLD